MDYSVHLQSPLSATTLASFDKETSRHASYDNRKKKKLTQTEMGTAIETKKKSSVQDKMAQNPHHRITSNEAEDTL